MKVAEAPAETLAPEPTAPPAAAVHRLRDLDRRGRWCAVALAGALLLMPVIAFVQIAPDWTPSGDPALMALRALDVGTARTPVMGQPSTSYLYVGDVPNVSHPGPLHFYLLALPVRALGPVYGMLLVSLLITGGCVLLSAWAIFRQLGPQGGVLGAVILGTITFTTGAASLMHPVSSSIAGYPVLCSMVLLWCLLCGDLRLLPLATVVVSFAAQQHLSSVPALLVTTVLVGAMVVGREVRRRRGQPAEPGLVRRCAWSAALAAVLWSPVLVQQVFSVQGNLTALVRFTRHDSRPSVGLRSAGNELVHVLGLPPLLGQLNPTGYWLLREASAARWISAAVVVGLTVVVGIRSRRSHWPRTALAVMVLVVAVAGLVNGSSVPRGIEMGRMAFYHWVWPLSLFVALGLGLAALEWWQRTSLARRRWATPAALALAVVAIALPAAMNPLLDRTSSTVLAAGSPVPRHYFDDMTDAILAHRDVLGERTVVLERGDVGFEGFGSALSLSLIERGVDVRMQRRLGDLKFVDADRMAERGSLDSGVVLVIGDGIVPYTRPVPGRHLASVLTTDFDVEAYDDLVATFESADRIVLGADLEQALRDLPDAYEVLIREALNSLPANAPQLSKDPNILSLLRDHPLQEPQLDPVMIDRVIESATHLEPGYQLDVYLLDRDQLMDYARTSEIG